jgi:hypothetical protein
VTRPDKISPALNKINTASRKLLREMRRGIGTRCLWTIMMLIFLTVLLLLIIILVAMFSKFEDEW